MLSRALRTAVTLSPVPFLTSTSMLFISPTSGGSLLHPATTCMLPNCLVTCADASLVLEGKMIIAEARRTVNNRNASTVTADARICMEKHRIHSAYYFFVLFGSCTRKTQKVKYQMSMSFQCKSYACTLLYIVEDNNGSNYRSCLICPHHYFIDIAS